MLVAKETKGVNDQQKNFAIEFFVESRLKPMILLGHLTEQFLRRHL